MKKIITIMLCGFMLCGCGAKTSTTTNESSPKPEMSVVTDESQLEKEPENTDFNSEIDIAELQKNVFLGAAYPEDRSVDEIAVIWANDGYLSKNSIISGLKEHGVTESEANSAVSKLNVDFKVNALKRAAIKYYAGIPEEDLKEALMADKFDGRFEPDEVDYALEHLHDKN